MSYRMRLNVLLAGASVFLVSHASFGAGFALYEGAVRGTSLGGSLTGAADDPSALYYNPAGITQLKGLQLQAGFVAIQPQSETTTMTPMGPVKTETEENWWIPPHLYATYGINDRVWAGVGVFSPFGLGTEYPSDWPGRYNNYEAVIQTLNINPNIAVKLTDRLSVAAGASAEWFDLSLKRMLPVMGRDIPFELTGDDIGVGYNVAAHYRVFDWLSVGASYRSEVEEEIDGTADASVLGETGATGDVTLPDFLSLGVRVQPWKRVGFELGATRTGWSSYDQLKIEFDDPTVLGKADSVTQKNWDDVWRYCAGIEFALTDALDLRAGYTYDQTPDPDEHADYLIPANDRQIFGLGLGYRRGDWSVDVSYSYLYIMDRTIAGNLAEGVLPSEFDNGDAHMIGLSVGTKL